MRRGTIIKKILYTAFLISFQTNLIFAQQNFQKKINLTFDFMASAIVKTPDGGFILGGGEPFSPFQIFTGLVHGEGNLIKTDSMGTILWSKSYTISPLYWSHHCVIIDLLPMPDNGCIALGYIPPGMTVGTSLLVFRVDSAGTLLWEMIHNNIPVKQLPPYRLEKISDTTFIALGVGSGLAVAGVFGFVYHPSGVPSTGITFFNHADIMRNICADGKKGYILFDENMIMSFDAANSLKWGKAFTLNVPNTTPFPKGVMTADSGFVITQTVYSTGTETDQVLIKLSNSGNILWSKLLPHPGMEYPVNLISMPDNGFLLALNLSNGTTNKICFSKFDSTGTVQWSKISGDSLQLWHMRPTQNNRFIASGVSNYNTALTGTQTGYMMEQTISSNSYCNYSAYVLGDSTIAVSSFPQVPQPPTGLIFPQAPGLFKQNVTASENLICSSISSDIEYLSNDALFSIYPNPVQDIIHITPATDFIPAQFILFDAAGRKVMDKKLNKTASFPVSQLNEGIYFYIIQDENGKVERGKLVKM